MRDQNGRVDSNFALIAAGVIFGIVYGSLYPFHFRRNPDPNGPLRALIQTWRGPLGRGDFVANVLLYAPLGLFSVQELQRVPPIARIALVSLLQASRCLSPQWNCYSSTMRVAFRLSRMFMPTRLA